MLDEALKLNLFQKSDRIVKTEVVNFLRDDLPADKDLYVIVSTVWNGSEETFEYK